MPRRRRKFTGPKQPFERALAVRPPPPATIALVLVRQLAGLQRSAVADLAPHLADQLLALAAEDGERLVDALAAPGARHPPAQLRLQGYRHEGGLVAPVLKQRAFASGVSQSPQILEVVGAEARERWQGMSARQDIDRIDLQYAQPLDQPPQGALVIAREQTRFGKALGGERDAPRLDERERLASAPHQGFPWVWRWVEQARRSKGARRGQRPACSGSSPSRPGHRQQRGDGEPRQPLAAWPLPVLSGGRRAGR